MRLILNGKINKLYVQSLCMVFFRGEKFPENEQNPRGTIYVKTTESQNGIEAVCELNYDDKKACTSAFVEFEPCDSYDRTSKCAVGKAVYLAGKELTGREAPWGILTGIRPSKVASELLLRLSYENAHKVLVEKYLLAPNKASLTLDVAKNEAKIFNKYGEDTCSLYISIPFCPTRCDYCSFISYATKKLFDLIPSYLTRLYVDIYEKCRLIKELGLKLVTVYVGGGTPTTLNEEQLKELLTVVSNCVDISSLDEFTIECGRPDTITQKKLEIIKSFGVKRISVNPQTLNDKVLLSIGRRHTVKDFYDAYKLVENVGIDIVNTDLIAGLDGDSFESFKSTVDNIVRLNPNNVTVHSFSIKKSAKVLQGNASIFEYSSDFAVSSVDYAYNELVTNGYEPYYMYRQKNTVSDLENVGYAKKGTFGIYNVLMMSDNHTVFSSGAGATTKLVKNLSINKEILRIFSPKYPYEYLQDKQDSCKAILNFFN